MTSNKSITVYLGSSGRCRDVFKQEAASLGKAMAQGGYKLVYGGMDAGLMGILANSVIEHGGDVLGIVPRKIKDILRFHKHLSEHILVDTLWERKRLLFEHGDALAVFPGGFGTLDEALEVLYWARLGKHAKPIIFINLGGYWDNALAHLSSLPDLPQNLYTAVEKTEDLTAAVETVSVRRTAGNGVADLPHFENDVVQDTRTPILIEEATLEETYRLVTALGLKQVGAHSRPIGLLNTYGDWDRLLAWISDAAREKFITDKCPDLLASAKNGKDLLAKLEAGKPIVIDLVTEKWGVDPKAGTVKA